MDTIACAVGGGSCCHWYVSFPRLPFLSPNKYISDIKTSAGLVRAPVGTTAMQVASRLLLVWGIVDTFPYLAKSAGYSSMLIAWSVTEVVRYSYFVFTLSGYSPGFISWLRYNLFYVLYPLGISSECWLIYKAIEPAREVRQELAWLLQLILFVYVPGKFYGDFRGAELMTDRILCSVHAYDGSEEEGYERKADTEGGVNAAFWKLDTDRS